MRELVNHLILFLVKLMSWLAKTTSTLLNRFVIIHQSQHVLQKMTIIAIIWTRIHKWEFLGLELWKRYRSASNMFTWRPSMSIIWLVAHAQLSITSSLVQCTLSMLVLWQLKIAKLEWFAQLSSRQLDGVTVENTRSMVKSSNKKDQKNNLVALQANGVKKPNIRLRVKWNRKRCCGSQTLFQRNTTGNISLLSMRWTLITYLKAWNSISQGLTADLDQTSEL